MKLRALEREPFSPLVHLEIAMSHFNQRRYDDTIEWAEKTLQLDPCHSLARELRAGASLVKGRGRLQYRDIAKPRASLLGNAGSYGDGVLERALQRARAQELDVPDLHLAVFCSAVGDSDRAFRYLNQAIDSRDPGLLRLAVAPQWDNLRSDSRFNQCLARMGIE
jgi:tetratricopeptide (TPR) repeat protein